MFFLILYALFCRLRIIFTFRIRINMGIKSFISSDNLCVGTTKVRGLHWKTSEARLDAPQGAPRRGERNESIRVCERGIVLRTDPPNKPNNSQTACFGGGTKKQKRRFMRNAFIHF